MDYISEELEFNAAQWETPRSPMPHVDSYNLGSTLIPSSVSSQPLGGTSSSRGSKRKAPMVEVLDAQFDKLNTRLEGFTNFIGWWC